VAYTDNKTSDYGSWGWWQGQRVNRRTHDALLTAGRLSGTWGSVRVSQGGLSVAVSASALTHSGLDAADIAIDGRSKDEVWKFCTALMKCGAIPFPRGYVDSNGWQDPWKDQKHIHVVMFNGDYAHRQARDQINAARYGYRYGRNGLAGHPGPYTGPARQPLVAWEDSEHNPEADMPLSDTDITRIAEAVWNRDGIPNWTPAAADNANMQSDNALYELGRQLNAVQAQLDALAAKLGETP